MRSGAGRATLRLMALALCVAGCAGTEVASQPPAAQPKPAPVVAETDVPQSAQLEPGERRRLLEGLRANVEEYFRLLREKSVEKAATLAVPEKRQGLKDDLWEYVGRYRIESADIASEQLLTEGDTLVAKVKVRQTLFEKNSVVPERSESWMTWQYDGVRWLLRKTNGP